MNKTKPNPRPSLTSKKGFTLIEVLLYLAITGLVIIIGFNFMSGRSQQVQFTDSMRSLNDSLNQEYNQFVSGVKHFDYGCTYPPAPPPNNATIDKADPSISDGTCVLSGKVIIFDDGLTGGDATQYAVYDLVGRNIDNDDFADTEVECNIEDFTCVDTTVIEQTPRTNDILWGVEFSRGIENTDGHFGNVGKQVSADNVRGFGFLRAPNSREVTTFALGKGLSFPSDLDDRALYRSHTSGSTQTVMGEELNSAFCFEAPDGKDAMIIVGDDQANESITLSFGAQHINDDGSVEFDCG